MNSVGNDEESIKVAERLRIAREYVGLSQAEIATLVGLPSAVITDIESGTRKPEVAELARFSSIYRRSVEYLITGNEPAQSGPEQFSFLARATNGLTPKDVSEVALFADFLRGSKNN